MRKIVLFLLLFTRLVFAENVKFYSPSFDCSKIQKDTVEYKICTNEELAKLDKKLSRIYEELKKTTINIEKFKLQHINWLESRNGCKTVQCIEYFYKTKIIEYKNFSSSFSQIERQIEKSEYEECLKSISPIQQGDCVAKTTIQWENKLEELHQQILKVIDNEKNWFYRSLTINYKYTPKKILFIQKNLKQVYLKNHQNWLEYKYSLDSYWEQTFGQQMGTLYYLKLQGKKQWIIKERVKELISMKLALER